MEKISGDRITCDWLNFFFAIAPCSLHDLPFDSIKKKNDEQNEIRLLLDDLWWTTRKSIYHKNDPSNCINRVSLEIVKQHLGKPIDELKKWREKKVKRAHSTWYIQRLSNGKCQFLLSNRSSESRERRKKNLWLSSSDDSVWIVRFRHRLIYFTWS